MGRIIAIVGGIILILLLLIMPIVGSYNRIVTLDQKVKSAESNIGTQLQRRSDLIGNLVETVKGYAAQEKSIFIDIANARAKLGGAQNISDKAAADNQLSSALRGLMIVVERYPELKSSENFRDLNVALEGTENRIAISRQDYNKAVDAYNVSVRKFPSSIIASIFRFPERPYYRAAEGASEVPKVDFSK